MEFLIIILHTQLSYYDAEGGKCSFNLNSHKKILMIFIHRLKNRPHEKIFQMAACHCFSVELTLMSNTESVFILSVNPNIEEP